MSLFHNRSPQPGACAGGLHRALRAAAHTVLALLLVQPLLARAGDAPMELWYGYTARQRPLKLYVFEPAAATKPASGEAAPARAAVLLFHGGGWNQGTPEWTYGPARLFAEHGLVAIAVQYQLSGQGITPVDALGDTCKAFRWVREHAGSLGIDPDRIAGYGASAGGQLVAAAATVGCPAGSATRGAPDLLLLWSAALDVADMYWFKQQMASVAPAADYSPLAHVGATAPPTVIVHGADDAITPYAGATAFCRRVIATGQVCERYGYPRLGHLLSKRLAEQATVIDEDRVAAADGENKLIGFLVRQGYATAP